MSETTETATRAEQIVYLADWAARYGATLQLAGEVGFGRECVGILKGSTYIDTQDVKNATAYNHEAEPGSWWAPEDAYHKHDCLAVLGRGDEALDQLYQWVKWLDGHGYGVEEVYREPASNIDLAFHGISLPKLVKMPVSATDEADLIPAGYEGPSSAFAHGPLPWPPTQEAADEAGVSLMRGTAADPDGEG